MKGNDQKKRNRQSSPKVRGRQVSVSDQSSYVAWGSSRIVHSRSNKVVRYAHESFSFGQRYPITDNEAFRYSGSHIPQTIKMGGHQEIIDQTGERPLQAEPTNFKII